MAGWMTNPDVLVLLAGVSFIMGYLIINQIFLRIMMAIGTLFYIAYYANVSDVPLWTAIYTSIAMGIANLTGLCALLARKSPWMVPTAHRDLYANLPHLAPGDFRSLMKKGTRRITQTDMVLTQQGELQDHLYYVYQGQMIVEKTGDRFDLPSGVFVGEAAFVLQGRAAATTKLLAGADLVAWDRVRLDRACRRNPRFKLVLEAAISHDMAAKVALAVAPQHLRPEGQGFDTVRAAQ